MHNEVSQSRSHTIHHWNRPTSWEHFSSSSRLDLSFSLAEVSGSSSCLAYAHLLSVDPSPCRRPAREPSMLLDIMFVQTIRMRRMSAVSPRENQIEMKTGNKEAGPHSFP